MATSRTSAARRLLSLSVQQTRCYSAPTDGAIPPNKAKYVPTEGTYPKGFVVGSAHAQVKASNTKFDDLALIASEVPCSAALVTTQNHFQAAPVSVSKKIMFQHQSKSIRGVVINSGCANAVTGKGGREDAVRMAKLTHDLLNKRNPTEDDQDVSSIRTLVMSTGVIGQRLPIDRIEAKIPTLVESLGNTHDHWLRSARAICTTDTFPKLLSRQFTLPSYPGITFSLAGMTKGAGMIHPNMATLLGVICTDAPIQKTALKVLLSTATNSSFNRITVDGDTSTNDSVALFSNGMAAPKSEPLERQSEDYKEMNKVLTSFMEDLAKLIVRDGEGATKFVTVRVTKADNFNAAHLVANSIATSALVKTALYGKDANWGRILCAIGYAPGNTCIRPQQTSVSFVPADGSEELKLLVDGEPQAVDEARAAAILEMEDLEILVKLSNREQDVAETAVYTCDFSHEYVTINGDYRT
ncbi:Arginine biosynthesis bifunctional protein ArgJ beta chain [Aureobasidium namibiae CBS 147.97]|uniref:Arginine biosynthesis bifunctional protein ArgJ, mitochondrial n=1 Tax=Aureobasidium namibiae CBS 147.97 TaxID=1043004 RepID=A0A074X942_9PEZI|nr:Arginine biosynthesis bifunctional protein ArgJ beta chain [Aureobasidium namibiae CBS 147.97]KEQ71111.1 Arginine biosynthesis bifunctional protein ArgJ beta chain [Aureobasidium namibiae CBS 147.97]